MTPAAEPVRPRVQVADVGVRSLVVLADLGQHRAGHRQDGGDEHVLDGEAHHLGQQFVVVARRLHLLEQPQVAVVLHVGRPLAGVGDDGVVLALVFRHIAGNHVGVRAIPPRRVVHAGLPTVVQRDPAVRLLVARLGQPAVPAHQIVPAAVEERLGHRTGGAPARAGVVEDALHGDRVHRRLRDARRVPRARRVGRQRRGRPSRRTREVAVDPVGEHDVRDHPVGPLRRQQRVELDDRPLDAQRGQADRDERRVPAPHVRVQKRRRGRHHAQVVAAQQVRGAGRELRGSEAGIGCHRSHDRSR